MSSYSDIRNSNEARKEFCASLVHTPPEAGSEAEAGAVRPQPTVRIFTDFDGTITREDVGEELLRRFSTAADIESVLDAWNRGEVNAVETYRRLYAGVPRLTDAMLDEFLAAYEIDPSFARFAEWSRKQGFPLVILSDGFDAYITRLLRRGGVEAELRANHMLLGDAAPQLDFPYADRRCPQIANCKSNHVALLSQDEDIVVYVGDGASDFEAAGYADLVFARGPLEGWCQEHNITFRRFYSFITVRDILSALIEQRKLRPRKRAQVLRQQLWATG